MDGFESLYEIDEDGLSYAFHVLALWRKKETGGLFFGTDSGCSCPTPWERTSESNLTPVTRETFGEFERAVNEFPADLTARQTIIAKAREALN